MSKINKKSINLGLKLLSVFAFALVFAPLNMVLADAGTNIIYQTPEAAPYVIPLSPAPVYYYVSQASAPVAPKPAPAASRIEVNSSLTNTGGSTQDNTGSVNSNNGTTSDQSNGYNNLASNAIFGTNGIMPSGIIGWVLFAIFVLLIIILVRRISGAKERYEMSPLKHE